MNILQSFHKFPKLVVLPCIAYTLHLTHLTQQWNMPRYAKWLYPGQPPGMMKIVRSDLRHSCRWQSITLVFGTQNAIGFQDMNFKNQLTVRWYNAWATSGQFGQCFSFNLLQPTVTFCVDSKSRLGKCRDARNAFLSIGQLWWNPDLRYGAQSELLTLKFKPIQLTAAIGCDIWDVSICFNCFQRSSFNR